MYKSLYKLVAPINTLLHFNFLRVKEPNFYTMDIDEEDDAPISLPKVDHIRKLTDEYIEVHEYFFYPK